MAITWFQNPKAFKHLIKYRQVYTLRPNIKPEKEKHVLMTTLEMKNGEIVRAKRHKFGEGRIRKATALNPSVSTEKLKPYVSESGFDSVEEWVSNLKDPRHTYHLYLVKLQ